MNATSVPASGISSSTRISCTTISHHLLWILIEHSMSHKVSTLHSCCGSESPTCIAHSLILNRCDGSLISPVHLWRHLINLTLCWCCWLPLSNISLNYTFSSYRLSLLHCPVRKLVDAKLVSKPLWLLHFFRIPMLYIFHSLPVHLLSPLILLFCAVRFGIIRHEPQKFMVFVRFL